MAKNFMGMKAKKMGEKKPKMSPADMKKMTGGSKSMKKMGSKKGC